MEERIYYLRDNKNIPVVAVGLLQKKEKGPITRAVVIRSNKDNCSKEKTRRLISIRLKDNEKILKRKYNIFPSIVIHRALSRLSVNDCNKVLDSDILDYKVNLDAKLTLFEKHILHLNITK